MTVSSYQIQSHKLTIIIPVSVMWVMYEGLVGIFMVSSVIIAHFSKLSGLWAAQLAIWVAYLMGCRFFC